MIQFMVAGFSFFALLYYYFTYTNRLVTKYYKDFMKDYEKVVVKKTSIKDEHNNSIETELYANCPNDEDTILKISANNNDKMKFNSAEMMTLLWYGDGERVRNGKCFNKDFTVLLILSIISDLFREGLIDICELGAYDKPIVIYMNNNNKTGIPYYDLCLSIFKDKKGIPLHMFVNMAAFYGINLRNMVIEDLEKKDLATREVKEIFNGKIKCNYWIVHMPMECQKWFRDFVYKDNNLDNSLKTMVNLMIISWDVLYEKDRLFRNIFGKNEFFYIQKKFTEGVNIPSIVIEGEYEILNPNKCLILNL